MKGREIVYLPQEETAAGSIAFVNKDKLLATAAKVDMVVIGPGLSLQEETVGLVKELAEAMRNRENGGDWKEFNFALQETMDDYCGYVRSETLLHAGISHLRRIKEKAYSTMVAKDQWQLTRCLEVLNLLDQCEAMCIAADARRESRGRHFRPDYPFTNAALEKLLLTIKKENGVPVTGWKKLSN